MNSIILMGRLVRDPELGYAEIKGRNTAVCKYTLAVPRFYNKDTEKQEADFFRCTTFGNKAEFAKRNFRQGLRILVQGTVRITSENKDNHWINYIEVIISQQEFADGKKNSPDTDPNLPGELPGSDYTPTPEEIDAAFRDCQDTQVPFNQNV